MLAILIKMLLRASPKIQFSEAEIAAYEKLVEKVHQGQLSPEEIPIPKYKFLHYLALTGDFVFHGSNNAQIETFEPREQTLFNSKPTKAVFASSEPIWSMFYAVFDRSKLVGGFRNGCLVNKKKKYHYYSLNKSTMEKDPWTSGKLYILPKEKFARSDHSKTHFDEWICHDVVKPISELEVHPDDFYFKDQVSVHKKDESLTKTWLLYKFRTSKSKQA